MGCVFFFLNKLGRQPQAGCLSLVICGDLLGCSRPWFSFSAQTLVWNLILMLCPFHRTRDVKSGVGDNHMLRPKAPPSKLWGFNPPQETPKLKTPRWKQPESERQADQSIEDLPPATWRHYWHGGSQAFPRECQVLPRSGAVGRGHCRCALWRCTSTAGAGQGEVKATSQGNRRELRNSFLVTTMLL